VIVIKSAIHNGLYLTHSAVSYDPVGLHAEKSQQTFGGSCGSSSIIREKEGKRKGENEGEGKKGREKEGKEEKGREREGQEWC